MTDHWQQLSIDWERSERDAELLENHLRINGLTTVERKLVTALHKHGQELWHEGLRVRSSWEVSMRQAARSAGLSLGGTSKAKQALERRGLLRYQPGLFELSWPRVWGLGDETALPTRSPPDRGEAFTLVHARSRSFTRPQYQEDISTLPTPNTQTKPRSGEEVTSGGPVAIGELVGEALDPAGAATRMHRRQVEQLAGRLLQRVGRLEQKDRTPADRLLQPGTAEEMAEGICGAPDSDTPDELAGILNWLDRQTQFTESPAAALAECCQRRRWLPRGRNTGGERGQRTTAE